MLSNILSLNKTVLYSTWSLYFCVVFFLIASLGTSSPGHKGESQDVTREPQVNRDSTMRAFLACTCFLVAHFACHNWTTYM